MFETGEEGGFFAEVTRERNIEDAWVVFGEGFHDI